jgi:anti-sigma factor RsiW
MRCDVVRRTLGENAEAPSQLAAHLATCPSCAEYARQWELVRAGLAELRKEELPEVSLGFAERLRRRLEQARAESQTRQQFILQAGRRMVYATLLVALILVLGLLLPSSGPFRSPGAAETFLAQPQAVLPSDQDTNDQLIGVDYTVAPGPAVAGQEPQSEGAR